MDRTYWEESVEESAKWSGKEKGELAREEYAKTARGEGEVGQDLTATARELEGSAAEAVPGDAAASGGATWDVNSKAADESGTGFCHGEKQREREKDADRREKPRPASPLEWKSERGDPRPPEWWKTLGGIIREWEGESSHQRASKNQEWKSCPGERNLWTDP